MKAREPFRPVGEGRKGRKFKARPARVVRVDYSKEDDLERRAALVARDQTWKLFERFSRRHLDGQDMEDAMRMLRAYCNTVGVCAMRIMEVMSPKKVSFTPSGAEVSNVEFDEGYPEGSGADDLPCNPT